MLFEEGADDMWVIEKGIYVPWLNDPPITKIKDRNVKKSKYVPVPQLFLLLIFYFALAQIDPNRRHVDKSVVAHFCKMLDSWIQMNRPSLVK